MKGRYIPERQFFMKSVRCYIIPYALSVLFIVSISVIQNFVMGTECQPDIIKWLSAAFYGSGSPLRWNYWPTELHAIGGIWFLLALFVSSNLLNAINKIRENTPGSEILAALLVCGIAWVGYYSALKGPWWPLSVQAGLTSLFFLYIGQTTYIYIYENGLYKKIPIVLWMIMGGIWAYCALFCGKLYMVSNTYTDGMMDIIGGICGTFCVIALCYLMEQKLKYIPSVLAFIGRRTLVILCVHTIEAKFVNYWTDVPNLLNCIGVSWFTICVVRLLIVTAGVAVIALIPGINNVFSLKK